MCVGPSALLGDTEHTERGPCCEGWAGWTCCTRALRLGAVRRWAVGQVVLTQEEGQVGAGAQGCGVSRRGAAWPRPLSPRQQDRAATGYLASQGCRLIPVSRWYFSSFLSHYHFFFNKNNYEGSKMPFFLDIPALRPQQHVGGKEGPLSPRPLAFI